MLIFEIIFSPDTHLQMAELTENEQLVLEKIRGAGTAGIQYAQYPNNSL